jgi:hypothetical protein
MRFTQTLAAATAAAAALAGVALAAPATASDAPSSLAAALGVDPDSGVGGFDRDWYDFDIVREAAEAVLATRADQGRSTLVAALADPDAEITAFLPNDRAFQVLEYSLTGTWEWSESRVFTGIVAAAGTLGDPIDVVEQILLYHVTTEGAIDSATVLSLKNASLEARTLTMANGGDVVLRVWSADPRFPIVALRDQDPDALNPTLVPSKLDIRAGDGIAHGISLVLRPLDLPRG